MITLDEPTRIELRKLQRKETDKRKHVRLTVILMLDHGFSAADVAYSFNLDDSTIYRYIDQYQTQDLESYLNDNYTGYTGRLTAEQRQELEKELEKNLYLNTKQIIGFIKERFAIEYTTTGIVPLLHSMGYVYKKTTQQSDKADAEEQGAFVEKLNELLDNLPENEVIYFTDAVHPQHNTRPSYAWVKSGEQRIINANTGRNRVNINGALNAHDPTGVISRIDERINAQSTIKLYQQIERSNPTKEKIYVICDNARYYRNKILKEWLKGSRIEQLFLPTYSPNLNVIERLWKYMKKKAIDTQYYEKYEDFKTAIKEFFKNIKKHRAELTTLLTLNFHIPCFSQTN